MPEETNLQDCVIELHNIARKIEHEIGQGKLSEDLRKLADAFSDLIKDR